MRCVTLIVVFMLVASMQQEHGEKVQIPQPAKDQTTAHEAEGTVVIEVVWTAKDAAPGVRINHRDVRWEDLICGWRRFIRSGRRKWRLCGGCGCGFSARGGCDRSSASGGRGADWIADAGAGETGGGSDDPACACGVVTAVIFCWAYGLLK